MLLVGFVFFLYLSYSLSIKNTIDLANQCSIYEEQLKFVKDAPLKIAELQKELNQKEKSLGFSSTKKEFQEQLLNNISTYCAENDLLLIEVPEVHTYKQHEYKIETYTTIVEGSYIKLLKLLYAIEQKFRIGKVVSVKFSSKKDYKTNELRLTLNMYIQNIKKEDYE